MTKADYKVIILQALFTEWFITQNEIQYTVPELFISWQVIILNGLIWLENNVYLTI